MMNKKVFSIIFVLILVYILVKKADTIKSLISSVLGGATKGIETLQGGNM